MCPILWVGPFAIPPSSFSPKLFVNLKEMKPFGYINFPLKTLQSVASKSQTCKIQLPTYETLFTFILSVNSCWCTKKGAYRGKSSYYESPSAARQLDPTVVSVQIHLLELDVLSMRVGNPSFFAPLNRAVVAVWLVHVLGEWVSSFKWPPQTRCKYATRCP